jgi:hypothetical protein
MISMVRDSCANQTTRLSASRKARMNHSSTAVDTPPGLRRRAWHPPRPQWPCVLSAPCRPSDKAQYVILPAPNPVPRHKMLGIYPPNRGGFSASLLPAASADKIPRCCGERRQDLDGAVGERRRPERPVGTLRAHERVAGRQRMRIGVVESLGGQFDECAVEGYA